jgi:hypothetical protein
MNWDEYNILFHKLKLNLVAFKKVIDCDEEILTLVNAAIDAAAQEKSKWVGLTGTEINHIFAANAGYPERMVQAAEAILKRKNT